MSAVAAFYSPMCVTGARADEYSLSLHHDGDEHGLHFSHPLIAESPTPDTKIRLDYFYANTSGEMSGNLHTARLEGEYAFSRSLSVEIDAPFSVFRPDGGPTFANTDNVDIALKYANFTFEKHGVVLGGGLEFGLPTGDDARGIGSNNVLEISPFLDAGLKVDRFEFVAFATFSAPLNDRGGENTDLELGWNFSTLYHFNERIEGILELDGVEVFGGERDGTTIVNLTPGVKVAPFKSHKFKVGLGVSVPLTSDQEFHTMTVLSLFRHF